MISTIRRRRAATIAVLAAMAMVVLDAGVVNIALPTIANSLGVSAARSIHIVSAYQLALLVGLLPCAHAAERFGDRRLFLLNDQRPRASVVQCPRHAGVCR